MQTFVILRRSGWANSDDLAAAGERSTTTATEMKDDLSWIRSYVLSEADGRVGTVCIYTAKDADTIRQHATASGLPADEIIPVADLVVIEPDPA